MCEIGKIVAQIVASDSTWITFFIYCTWHHVTEALAHSGASLAERSKSGTIWTDLQKEVKYMIMHAMRQQILWDFDSQSIWASDLLGSYPRVFLFC